MAACFTHPLDQTKYRMQVLTHKQGMLRTLIHFASRDGFFSLWQGISASILRQSTYSTARFGLYNYFASEMRQRSGQAKISSVSEIGCAALAGGIAGMIGNPTEVALVRMCADGAKESAQRFRYRHCFDAIIRIGREEGVRTFARGLGPNITRSVLMNVSQIVSYSVAKQQLLGMGATDGLPTHFTASFVAGTVATTACAPADVLKSRVQNAVVTDGVRPSVTKIIVQSLSKEGPLFLMRGWTPAWMRLAPYTILTFVFMEQLKKLVEVSRDRPRLEETVGGVPQKT